MQDQGTQILIEALLVVETSEPRKYLLEACQPPCLKMDFVSTLRSMAM